MAGPQDATASARRRGESPGPAATAPIRARRTATIGDGETARDRQGRGARAEAGMTRHLPCTVARTAAAAATLARIGSVPDLGDRRDLLAAASAAEVRAVGRVAGGA